MRRRISTWIAVLGLCLSYGCEDEAPPAPADACAPFRNDLAAIAGKATEFADIPAGDDAKTQKYFIQAAKLAVLQRNLHVEKMLSADFQDLADHPLLFGSPGVPKAQALEGKAAADEKRVELEAQIEALLKEADDNGLPLRDEKGAAVIASRIMLATFWREVALQAKTFVVACDDKSAAVAEIQKLIDDVLLLETADTHGLIEHGRIGYYLQKEAMP